MKRLTLEWAQDYVWTPEHKPYWDNGVIRIVEGVPGVVSSPVILKEPDDILVVMPKIQIAHLLLQINVMEVSTTQWYEWGKLFKHPLKWLEHRLCRNTSDYRIELSASLENDQMDKIVRRYFGSVWNDGEHLIEEAVYVDSSEPLYVHLHIDLAKGHIVRYQIVATVFYE